MNNIKNFFIITSIIYLSEKPLSYSKSRSRYSPDDRALQTVRTIQSIREKVPDAKIILIESGLQKELPYNLSELADEYLYIGSKFIVRLVCDSRFKGLGEIISLLHLKFSKLNKRNNYFKISGRYYLNDNFKINEWGVGLFNFKFRSPKSISTVLYMVRGSAVYQWCIAMLLTIPFCLINRSIENVIFRFIPRRHIVSMDRIGVSGLDAVYGQYFNE